MSENLSQKAYSYIHDKLTTGSFRPGLRLSNRKVASEIGVSFTPVREALNRLVSEGLLEYRDGLGVFVPEATRQEIEDLYEVREMLECEVMTRVCERLTPQMLQEMRNLDAQMRRTMNLIESKGRKDEYGERFRELDSAFHLTLIRWMGNRHLLDILSDLRKKCAIKSGGASSREELVTHIFRDEPLKDIQRTLREHEDLLSFLEKKDGQNAALLMRQHIRAGRQLALAAIDRNYMNASRHIAAPPQVAAKQVQS